MKVLLLLVLALFAVGSDAQTVPDQQVAMLKNAFWEYVSKATTAADETLKQIKLSELGKEVNVFISQSSEAVTRFSDALQTQVAPLSQDLLQKLHRETRQMQKRLEKDLNTFSSKVQPFTDDLVAKLQKQVVDLQKEAATFAKTMDTERLKSSLIQKSQSMNQDLQAQVGSYVEMKQKMEESLGEFQRRVTALSQSFEAEVNKKVESFAPYREEIRSQFELEAANMRKQLETLWKSFTKMMK